jgi:putative transposase
MKFEDIMLQYLEDDKEAMKKLLSFFLNKVMLEEAKIQVRANEYERSHLRKAHRNGYKQRSLKTRNGTIELDEPQIKKISF